MTRKNLGLWLLSVGLLTGCTFITQIFVTPRAAVTYVASPTGNDAAGTPCTDAQPCSVRRALLTMDCANNDVLELLGTGAGDGVYQGANYMLSLPSGKSGTDSAHQCTVRARNEGGVFIDGQFARVPFDSSGSAWWTITGIDVGNAGPPDAGNWVIQIAGASHLTMRRICASNTFLSTTGAPVGAGSNGMVMGFYGAESSDNTFEDFCLFGTGRNVLVESSHGSNNVFRRFWFRWEGWCHDGAMILQAPYHSDTATPTSGNNIYENFILVYDPEQQSGCPTRGSFEPLSNRTPTLATTWAGIVMYGYNGFTSAATQVKSSWWGDTDSRSGCVSVFLPQCPSTYAGARIRNLKDIFIDTRSQTSVVHRAFLMSCDSALGSGSNCNSNSADRLTSIINAGNDASSFLWANRTNTNECTSLASCPNFYTGSSPGTGARNCFEYTNGVLGSNAATQGLWPWRMDNRVKGALARAKAAGTGGNPLQGGAGSGYAAGTVTSEIASLYGPVPAACSRTTTVFTPDFPVVTDFPSTPVIDTFDRANGAIGSSWTYIASPSPGFTIASNQLTASTATRALYNVAALTPQQESYGTWITVPPDGSESVLLMAANTTLDDSTGWHLILQRVSSGNDRLKVARIPGGYNEILNVDLGGKVADGNLFGIRITALQTLAVYWRYSGVTYRVGSVIDTNLPLTSTQRIGLGGAPGTGVVINDFGGGSTGGVPPTPGNIGRFGNLFPKQ